MELNDGLFFVDRLDKELAVVIRNKQITRLVIKNLGCFDPFSGGFIFQVEGVR